MPVRKDLIVTFLLIAVAPFCVFIHFAPLGDFWDIFIACSAVAVCSVIVLGWNIFKTKTLYFSSFLGSIAAFFLLLCLLVVIQRAQLSDQLTLLIYAVIVFLGGLLALQLSAHNQAQYYDYLAFVLLLGGIVESIGAIAIQYRLWGIDYWMVPMSDRFIGFIAQSNQFAIYVMIAFLASCYLAIRRCLPVFLLVAICLLFGFVLLGSGSRAVLLYVVASFIAALFCLFYCGEKRYYKFLVGLCALIGGGIIYYYLPDIMHSLASDPQIKTELALGRSATSDSFRLSELNKAFAMFKAHPLLGVGFGNYAAQGFWLSVDNPSYVIIGDLTLHSHNLFAQILAEFGGVGFIALVALLAYIGRCFLRMAKTPQWWLVFSVFAVYFINSMLEYVMWRMQFIPLFTLIFMPLFTPIIKVYCHRFITAGVALGVAVVFGVLANISLDAYAKSFLYTDEIVEFDQSDFNKYKAATHNLLWGRELQMQAFTHLSPAIYDLPYQQKITDEMLAWRPYAPVLANKIQLLLLTGQIGDLDKLSYALARYYPTMVPVVCDYFKNFNQIPNVQGLRMVKKGLDCRVISKSVGY